MADPRMALVVAARSQLGVAETSRNRGPGIAKFWTATSYPKGMENREPWCAAFVAWVVRQAMCEEPRLHLEESTRPKGAAVSAWAPAARRLGWLVFEPGNLAPAPGDIVVFRFSHIAIVEAFNGSCLTIEGNTDDAGAREGREVAARLRSLAACRYFLRIPLRDSRRLSNVH